MPTALRFFCTLWPSLLAQLLAQPLLAEPVYGEGKAFPALGGSACTVTRLSIPFLRNTRLPGHIQAAYTAWAPGLTDAPLRPVAPTPRLLGTSAGGVHAKPVSLSASGASSLLPTTSQPAQLPPGPGAFMSGAGAHFPAQAKQLFTALIGYKMGMDSAVSEPAGLYPKQETARFASGAVRHPVPGNADPLRQHVVSTGAAIPTGAPVISVSSGSLTVVDYSTYPGSLPTAYTVTATGLADGLEIVAPREYYVSAAGQTGPAIVLHTTNGVLPPTTVQVRLVSSTPGVYAGEIINRDWNRSAQTSLAISGTALGQDVIVEPSVLEGFVTRVGQPSASQTYTVTNRGGLAISVNSPPGFEIRTGNAPFGSGLTIEPSPVFKRTPVEIRLTGSSTGAQSTTVTHDTYFHSSHAIYPLAISGLVLDDTYGLQIWHRDVDNYADNNAVQPRLQLHNQTALPLSLSALTLRYYLTVEGGSPLSNLFTNYAQIGNQNVKLRYEPMAPGRPGTSGYVEISFTAGAGALAPGQNSGDLQLYFAKSDYAALNELDDYSYATARDQLLATTRITAHYQGLLIAGVEPTAARALTAVQAYTESKNGPSATQIHTYLTIRNTGNVPIGYGELKARYYFTSDGAEPLQTEVDEGNVQVQLVRLPSAVNGANMYAEVSFLQSGVLYPGISSGRIRYRISKPGGGRFDQTNDHSYQERPEQSSLNNQLPLYVNGLLAFGSPPVEAFARRTAQSTESTEALRVEVLGNPLAGDQLRVDVSGAQGQPLRFSVHEVSGRLVSEQRLQTARSLESQSLAVGRAAPGLLLLQVSTPTQQKTVRVLKMQ